MQERVLEKTLVQCMVEGKPLVITEVVVKRLTGASEGNSLIGVLTCRRQPQRAQGSMKTMVSNEIIYLFITLTFCVVLYTVL